VSPQLRSLVAESPDEDWKKVPSSAAEWKTVVGAAADRTVAKLPKMREALGVTVEPTTIAGVKAFWVTPRNRPARNQARVLLHLHGGARVFNPGEAGTREAILMAGLAGFRVLSVDYRMPPDFPYPAALDDAIAVYRELLKTQRGKNIGIFGNSAGGSLALTTVLRARKEKLPLPGAIVASTPTADLTWTGDTLFANEWVDNSLGTRKGVIDATIELSNTVRVHRAMRAAGVDAVLHVWEALSHGQWNYVLDAPETREYHDEVARFLDAHLGT